MNGIEEREEAEIATFTPEELREYEDSLKAYRDIKNSIDTARREGRVEGEAREKKATIKRLLASSASVDIIAIATGMSKADVRLLIDEISKEWYSHVRIMRWIPGLNVFLYAYRIGSIFQSLIVRRSSSKLMPTFTIGSPHRANRAG